MTVTSVRGHLNETDFGEGFRKWHDCDPVALFDAPIVERLTDVSHEAIIFKMHLGIRGRKG